MLGSRERGALLVQRASRTRASKRTRSRGERRDTTWLGFLRDEAQPRREEKQWSEVLEAWHWHQRKQQNNRKAKKYGERESGRSVGEDEA